MMNQLPLVSVIIPTYNRSGMICRTIDNVFQQTYRRFELIVVDDGSTDDTERTLKRYGNKIRVIQQANAGPSVARNRGVRESRGALIAFQDSDDLWHPTKLERQVALLQKDRSVPVCLCGILLRQVSGRPFTSFDHSRIRLPSDQGIWMNVLEVLATRFVFFNQAVVIRREVFERAGGFPEDLKYLEDYDLPLRLALEGAWAFIREPLVFYGEGSPVSFSEQAQKDPVTLAECEVKVFERALKRTLPQENCGKIRQLLNWKLAMAKRRLAALASARNESSLPRIFTECALKWDRYLMAAFRRSPWFPQPITADLRCSPLA